LNGVSCWHWSIVILFYMFYFGLIVVMAVCWWYFLSDEHVCFLFAAFSVGLAYVTWAFLYLGMLVLCGYLLVIFGTCVCYLSFLHLGMSVVCLLVHLGFCFRFLILGVLFCVCLNLFFDVFYLRQLFYLRDVSATCVMFLCLLVFTWACPSVSCSLWVFSMGRICISILARVTHVRLIFSFLVGRHFGLVGIDAFVEGLGLPLTWGMAVLDVLLLLFSVFFCKSNLHWFPYAIFKHVFALVIRFLCTFLCTSYALFVHFFLHFLCISFSLFMRFLCALKKRTKSVYTFFKKCMHFLCAF
jgi:hypothetical protein